jgi:hypothetical protein
MRRSCRGTTRSRRRRPSTTRAGGRKLPDEGRVLTLSHASGGDGGEGCKPPPGAEPTSGAGCWGRVVSCGLWVVDGGWSGREAIGYVCVRLWVRGGCGCSSR